ncbi:hypothetical protein GH721_14480 [Kriegella sp. EG-1]|nr:hypothetical protein [Flavobacteriaceae bacterium EG-1]
MKKLLITITLVLMAKSLNAQDKIYFKDGVTVDAKILVVSESVIQYKRMDNRSGPTFEIGVSKIDKIAYENGSQQVFKKDISSKNSSNEFRQDRLYLDLINYGRNGATSISYERLNDDGSRGIEIPFSVYFDGVDIEGYTLGANLKFYLKKQGKGFHYGPSIRLGVFDWYYDSYYSFSYSTDFTAYLGLKLGYQFQLSRLFGLNLNANGGGFSNFTEFDYGYSANLGMNFSF